MLFDDQLQISAGTLSRLLDIVFGPVFPHPNHSLAFFGDLDGVWRERCVGDGGGVGSRGVGWGHRF